MKIDDILERVGLQYEDLKREEKETLDQWMQALKQRKVTVETIKKHIVSMRETVERELATSKLGTKEDTFLKARLRNYLLLEAFLVSPERAKEALENAIAGMIPRKS